MALELFWCVTLGVISLPLIFKFPRKVLGKTDFSLSGRSRVIPSDGFWPTCQWSHMTNPLGFLALNCKEIKFLQSSIVPKVTELNLTKS